MIPESEILECSKYDVKSKKGNIFVSEKIPKFTKLILIFISTTKKKKKKLMRTDANIYYLELMFLFFKHKLAVEIDEKRHTDKNIKRKDKNYQKKGLIVNLLELTQVKNTKKRILKKVLQKNTTHNIRHEKHTIRNKTNNNWKRTWNNVLFGM